MTIQFLHLPAEILDQILHYLGDVELCTLERCNKELYNLLKSDDLLWENLLLRNFLMDKNDSLDHYQSYFEDVILHNEKEVDNCQFIYSVIYQTINPHIYSFYKPMKVVWDRIVYWLTKNLPKIKETLQPPLHPLKELYNINLLKSEPNIDNNNNNGSGQQYTFTELIKKNILPIDYICSVLIFNGQRFTRIPLGLFGTIESYNVTYSIYLLKFQDAVKLNESIGKSVAKISNCWIFAKSNMYRFYAIVVKPFQHGEHHFNRGQVLLVGGANSANMMFMPCALSYFDFLENYLLALENEVYTVRDQYILYRYPEYSNYVSEEETNGVKVKGSAVFIPEVSLPTRMVYYYRITISMDSDQDPKKSCKLVSRHWEIKSVSRNEEVEGTGVIGQYPIIQPGSKFEYCSRCEFSDPSGFMSGHFEFVLLSNPKLSQIDEYQLNITQSYADILDQNDLIRVNIPLFCLTPSQH